MREGTEPPDDAPADDAPLAVEPRDHGRLAVEPPDEAPAGEGPTVEPVPPPSPGDRGSIARSVALGVVAFAATLVLLAGFSSLITRSVERGAETTGTGAPSRAPGSLLPSVEPSSKGGAMRT